MALFLAFACILAFGWLPEVTKGAVLDLGGCAADVTLDSVSLEVLSCSSSCTNSEEFWFFGTLYQVVDGITIAVQHHSNGVVCSIASGVTSYEDCVNAVLKLNSIVSSTEVPVTATDPYDVTTETLAPTEYPEASSEAPGVITEAPVVTTEAPGVITEAPVVTTEAPGVITEAPVVTTEAPGVITEAPVVTTEAPGVITEAPVVTTEAPGVITEAPVVTTEAPGVITEAPIVTTETPGVITEAPVSYDCDATVTISHFSEDFWQTPNYPQDYPEDIVCTLTIINNLDMGFAIVDFEEPSEIHRTSSCASDYLEYQSSSATPAKMCGPLTESFSTELTVFDGPKISTLTFRSSSADGSTNTGVRVKVTGFNNLLG